MKVMIMDRQMIGVSQMGVLTFPWSKLFHWYPGSGVLLGCIDFWSLPSFLLSLVGQCLMFVIDWSHYGLTRTFFDLSQYVNLLKCFPVMIQYIS